MQQRTALAGPQASSSSGKQVVELNGYVIILVESRDGKIKLYGSPADKDNLEVADEILDVNERKLEDSPRAEVIKHIHECIQSCMIKLRVKRRSDSRLAGELGNAVQDAFVIAVEQQARERLQRLSALKRITPVDMSQLSIKLATLSEGELELQEETYESNSNISRGGTEVLLVDQTLRQENRTRRRSGSSIVVLDGDDTLKPSLPIDDYQEDFEMYNMISANQDNGPHREMAVDVPESFIARNKTPPRYPPPRSTTQVNHVSNAMPQVPKHVNGGVSLELEPLDGYSDKNSSSLDSSNEFYKKNSSKGPSSLGSACESIGFDSINYLKNSRGSLSTRSSSSGELGPPEYDIGPHRELPVDVPDSFVEVIKAPPRYPPPKALIIKEVVKKKESSSSDESIDNPKPQPQAPTRNELNGSVKPIPPPRDHLRIEKDGRLTNRAPVPAPQVPDRKVVPTTPQQHIGQVVEPTPDQLNSIKKFEEQLRRRREEEERIAAQNDFLRNSLRSSQRLRALQDNPVVEKPASGVENEAYIEDEEPEKIIGYGELVSALQRLQGHLNKHGLAALAGRVTAAQSLLLGPGIARALAARTAVLERRRPRIQNPICSNAQALAKDCVESLAQSSTPAAIELCDLLSTYEMEGLLLAQDRIASTTDRSPAYGVSAVSQNPTVPLPLNNNTMTSATPVKPTSVLPSIPNNTSLVNNNNNNIAKREPMSVPLGVLRDGSQDHIRIIQIEKSSEPLGATIRNEGEAVVIGRVVRGGAAEKSGLLHEGDELLEVNGIEMRGKSINDVCALLSAMTGTLTFLVVPASRPPLDPVIRGGTRSGSCAVLHVRAHFDYDPEDDRYIPCRELGISFQKGDVLHVISRDDPNWWQAYREGEEDQTLAGLIPSQSFQHLCESMKLANAGEVGLRARRDANGKAGGFTLLCARKGQKKKKKASSEHGYPLYATATAEDPEPEEILTYEEVALYYPRASHKRPIVLIGPPNIGRHELRQRLMADSERFAAAIPHTSRPQREGEIPGQDYHFISRQQFEADILARKFVEHGEYEKAYYGTSLEAIRAVVASGKICVLNLHPQSLKLLRSSDLKPYTVLVAPPSLEKLRQKRIRAGEPYKEEELKEIIATARDMEARWGHLFDMIIINNDTERAYHQLLAEINSLEREPQWVPSSWLHN
ncbi:protein PALS1 isoform X1 [Ochlerotatus camptorhynchus]|uniref:protein PALS1 isoform X1 n=1 Tax=Ochlerotatus camptorhynchus TaxID=644619 RepID=UPI0031DE7FBE